MSSNKYPKIDINTFSAFIDDVNKNSLRFLEGKQDKKVAQ